MARLTTTLSTIALAMVSFTLASTTQSAHRACGLGANFSGCLSSRPTPSRPTSTWSTLSSSVRSASFSATPLFSKKLEPVEERAETVIQTVFVPTTVLIKLSSSSTSQLPPCSTNVLPPDHNPSFEDGPSIWSRKPTFNPVALDDFGKNFPKYWDTFEGVQDSEGKVRISIQPKSSAPFPPDDGINATYIRYQAGAYTVPTTLYHNNVTTLYDHIYNCTVKT
ncbi:hypothetical protein T440DRAFT_515512 [Plenodomus tracheiphilus IPT5]|uniref:Uncharacterized protein n=1 Tax=Plenodomus tracheiphilus IPT5 TaxID=1408161 RepID=A0A6A7BDD0_9PLEO|nr:hypothetical protein T440DRAFT_515512 [Plenodomus tracheiphilus IPT5]